MIANNFFTSKGNTIEKVMKTIIAAIVLTITGWINTAEAMSRAEIEAAIEAGQLGDYLFVDHLEDPGVQQFIRHTRKHFCKPSSVNDDEKNPISSDTHTVLGNGNWGIGGHKNALKWALNAVTSKRVTMEEKEKGTDLIIKGLHVRDIKEFMKVPERHTKYIWKKRKRVNKQGEDATNSPITCTIHFNQDMTEIRYGGNDYDGVAGFCYVAEWD